MATLITLIDANPARRGADQFKRAGEDIVNTGRRVDRSVDSSNRRIRGLGTSALASSRSMGTLFAGFSAVYAVRQATRIMAEFEETMSIVRGVTGASIEEFRRLEAVARELGATTRFSAKEAGEGLLFLARAGFSANEAIAALPATLNLAAAGQLSLGEAADFASNILSQFNLSAAETVRVADVLTKTSNSANTDVRQLAEAMKYVGPIAGALEKSIEETSAAIGVLGDSGIQASLAGTNLRGVFSGLLGPTDTARKALERLNLTVDDLNPASHSTIEIFQRLREANLDAAGAVDIFGRRNASAALILSANVGKLEQLTQANMDAAGAAKEMARVASDNLAGAFRGLRSAIEEAAIATGQAGYAGALRDAVDSAASGIRILLGVADAQTRISESAQLTAVRLELLVDVLKAMVAIRATQYIVGLAASLGALAGPVGLVVAGVSALVYWLTETERAADRAARELEQLGKSPTPDQRKAMEDYKDLVGELADKSNEVVDAFAADNFDGALRALDQSIAIRQNIITALEGEVEKLSGLPRVSAEFLESFVGPQERLRIQLEQAVRAYSEHLAQLNSTLAEDRTPTGSQNLFGVSLRNQRAADVARARQALEDFDSLSAEQLRDLDKWQGQYAITVDAAKRALEGLIEKQREQIAVDQGSVRQGFVDRAQDILNLTQAEQEAVGVLQSLTQELEQEAEAIGRTQEELKALARERQIEAAIAALSATQNKQNIELRDQLVARLRAQQEETAKLRTQSEGQEVAEKAIRGVLSGALGVYEKLAQAIERTAEVRAKQRDTINELIREEVSQLRSMREQGQQLSLLDRINRQYDLAQRIRAEGTALVKDELERLLGVAKQEANSIHEADRAQREFNRTLESAKGAFERSGNAVLDWLDRVAERNEKVIEAQQGVQKILEGLRREREEIGKTADEIERLNLLRTLEATTRGLEPEARAQATAQALAALADKQSRAREFREETQAREEATRAAEELTEAEARNADLVQAAREQRERARRDLTALIATVREEREALGRSSEELRLQALLRRAQAIGTALTRSELAGYIQELGAEYRATVAANDAVESRERFVARLRDGLSGLADMLRRVAQAEREAQQEAQRGAEAALRRIDAIRLQREELGLSERERQRRALGRGLDSDLQGVGRFGAFALRTAAFAEQAALERAQDRIQTDADFGASVQAERQRLETANLARGDARTRSIETSRELRAEFDARIERLQFERSLIAKTNDEREIETELFEASARLVGLDAAERAERLAVLESELRATVEQRQVQEESTAAIDRAVASLEQLAAATDAATDARLADLEAADRARASVQERIEALRIEREELDLSAEQRSRNALLRRVEADLAGLEVDARERLVEALSREIDALEEAKRVRADSAAGVERAIASLQALEAATSAATRARDAYAASRAALAEEIQLAQLSSREAEVQAEVQRRLGDAYDTATAAQRRAVEEDVRRLRTLRQLRESTEEAAQFIGDRQFEVGLYGKAPSQRQAERDIRALGIDSNGEQAQAIRELAELEEHLKRLDQLAEGVGRSFADAFGSIIDGTRNVHQAFEDLVRNISRTVIDTLVKTIIQQQIANALRGVLSFGAPGGGASIGQHLGGYGPGGYSYPSARGNAFFGGNLIPFARGGLIDSPMIFPLRNGTGLAGEAGPEAILPLRRGRGGRLGVEAAGGGGGTQQVFNFRMTVHTPNADSFRRSERQLAETARRAARMATR